MSHQSRFDAQYWMLGAGALGRPRGMVWGGKREEGSGWGTHVCLWRIHFDIWQNQYNIVKFKNKKILQARLQQYVNHELPDVQAGFRKGRGTRDQIANIRWIIEKAREFQKNIYFCFIDYAKAFDSVDHNKLENLERDGNTRPPDRPLEKPICRSGSNS